MSKNKKELELQRYRLFHRILTDTAIDNDGKEFIEYLRTLKTNAVEDWLNNNNDYDDKINKGFALAIDKLIENFEECQEKINAIVNNQKEFDFSKGENNEWETDQGDQ